MRFAEHTSRLLSAMAAALVMAGCAAPTYEPQPMPEAKSSVPVRADRTPAVTQGTPTAPAVQRAFDEAVRAMRAGQTDQAEQGFRALVKAHPDLAGPHANLGLLLRQAGKLAEAATELEQAVNLSPRQAVYSNELGITYRQMGQFAKARASYERAIAMDANHAAAALNLGILHDLYLGNPGAAMTQYERYLALTPGGDATVTKWVAELKNRKPGTAAVSTKEQS